MRADCSCAKYKNAQGNAWPKIGIAPNLFLQLANILSEKLKYIVF